MAGDNLDLNAVMELFKKSDSVEDFENKLNSEKNDVNNLDLNNDGHVDYIRVIDHAEGDAHSLTLQVPYSDSEAQDVAVIELEQEGDNTTAQIIGDEELYGKDVIVEPITDSDNTSANVSGWKPVRYINSPRYVVYVSPWRWRHYPRWYKPWKPLGWRIYHGRVRHHHKHYRRTAHYRCHRAHKHYHKHRVHSVTFHGHHHHKHHNKNVKGGKVQVGKKPLNPKAPNPSKGVNKPVAKPKPQPAHKSGAQSKSRAKKSSAPTQSRGMGKPTKRPGATKSKAGGGKSKSNPKRGGRR